MSDGSLTFYTTNEYWLDLQRRIDSASRSGRIAMMVMDLNPDSPMIQTVLSKLLAAAKRGTQVWLLVDAHTFLFNHAARFISSYWLTNDLNRLPPALKAKFELLELINACPNGHAVIVNKPSHALSNPVAGRSHIKATVVDDYTYVGGCNLQKPEWVDIMVGLPSKPTSNYLIDFISAVALERSTYGVMQDEDRVMQLDTDTMLFIDAGKPGQSTILEQALAIIDAAEQSIFMTCQYFPNAITARHLSAAHARGVSIELIYSHPNMQGSVGSIGQRVNILIERTRVPTALFKGALPAEGPSLHAKLLATDKGAIIGSHNYVSAGVKLGTAEMALVSNDPLFSKQAVATIKRELNIMQVK